MTATATDRAGNQRALTSGPYDVDITDPEVTCASRPSFQLGQAGSVTATVADTGSGPVRPVVTASVDTSSVGPASAQVTGLDVAGRTITGSCPYQVVYGFSGFQAPVDQNAVNVTKAGSAVPLRWRLVDHAGSTAEYRFKG